MEPSTIVYKGISVDKLIQDNQEKGGVILSVGVQNQTYEITTRYIEGISVSIERLTYKGDLLETWELIYGDKTNLIFSRGEYDYFRSLYRKETT